MPKTVAQLIKALQEIPNPEVTNVQVESDLADTQADLGSIDLDGVISGGIDLADGGDVVLRETAE